MFVVDTNILIYAAESTYDEHDRCRELVEQWRRRRGAWYLTWGILYEFVRVTTHARVFETPWSIGEAWGFVRALLAAPAVRVLSATDRHAEVAHEVWEELPAISGNLVHDAHTAVLMREHGINRIYTRDGDFRQFPFVEAVNPLE